MTSLIELHDVHVSFSGHEVLGGVSLTLRTGDRLAVLGRNAVGKSTLLDVLLGLVRGRGDIRVFGQTPPSPEIGFMPQDPGNSLLPWYTVEENIALPLDIAGVPRTERRQSVEAIARRLDPDRTLPLNAHPHTLSGGQRQLTALMRALVNEPTVLVCDEPFSAIDAPSRTRLRHALREICDENGPALLLVTHDLDTALALATRVAVLKGAPARLTELDAETSREALETAWSAA